MHEHQLSASEIVEQFFPNDMYGGGDQRWPGGWPHFKGQIREAIQKALDQNENH